MTPNLISASLSPREREVVELRAAGLSYREAAKRLGIAVGTLREHLERSRRRIAPGATIDALCSFVQPTQKPTAKRKRASGKLPYGQTLEGWQEADL